HEERLRGAWREGGPVPGRHRDDRGVDPCRRPERGGGYAPDDPRIGERLHEDRQEPALASLPRRGADPCRDLALHENDDERWPPRVGEEALEERGRDLIWQVG